jgi:hypothetical protein
VRGRPLASADAVPPLSRGVLHRHGSGLALGQAQGQRLQCPAPLRSCVLTSNGNVMHRTASRACVLHTLALSSLRPAEG